MPEGSMLIGSVPRNVICATCAFGLSIALLTSSLTGAQAPDTAAHTQWMNDASDAQEDFRFAMTDKDQKAAGEALSKLEALMAKTESYWTARKASDGARLAKQAEGLASQGASAARSGNLSAAATAFARMSATCNSCHELHLEKR
jgi:hypothetical protein